MGTAPSGLNSTPSSSFIAPRQNGPANVNAAELMKQWQDRERDVWQWKEGERRRKSSARKEARAHRGAQAPSESSSSLANARRQRQPARSSNAWGSDSSQGGEDRTKRNEKAKRKHK